MSEHLPEDLWRTHKDPGESLPQIIVGRPGLLIPLTHFTKNKKEMLE